MAVWSIRPALPALVSAARSIWAPVVLAGAIITPAIDNHGQIVANFTGDAHPRRRYLRPGTLSKAGAGTLILTGDNPMPAVPPSPGASSTSILRTASARASSRSTAAACSGRPATAPTSPPNSPRSGPAGRRRDQWQQRHPRRIAFRARRPHQDRRGHDDADGRQQLSGRDNDQRRHGCGLHGRQPRGGGRRPRFRRWHAAIPDRFHHQSHRNAECWRRHVRHQRQQRNACRRDRRSRRPHQGGRRLDDALGRRHLSRRHDGNAGTLQAGAANTSRRSARSWSRRALRSTSRASTRPSCSPAPAP